MKNVEIMKKFIGIYETTIELSAILELRKADYIFCDNKYIWVCINSNLRLDLTIQICLQFALQLNWSSHLEQKWDIYNVFHIKLSNSLWKNEEKNVLKTSM